MGKVNYKNQYALLVYLVLRDYSDAGHLIEQPEILAHLSTDYGVETQRRSISRALDVLETLDFDLIRNRKGVALGGRVFDEGQLEYVLDAVYSSPSISPDDADKIFSRLTKTLSVEERKRLAGIEKEEERGKLANPHIFYEIGTIAGAIERNSLIEFTYNAYDEKGKLSPLEGNPRRVLPLKSFFRDGRYCLLAGTLESHSFLRLYIDRMTNVTEIPQDKKSPIVYTKDEIKRFLEKHPHLGAGEAIEAELEVEDERAFNSLFAYFGDVEKSEKAADGKYHVWVKADEESILSWCFALAGKVLLLAPEEAKRKLHQRAINLLSAAILPDSSSKSEPFSQLDFGVVRQNYAFDPLSLTAPPSLQITHGVSVASLLKEEVLSVGDFQKNFALSSHEIQEFMDLFLGRHPQTLDRLFLVEMGEKNENPAPSQILIGRSPIPCWLTRGQDTVLLSLLFLWRLSYLGYEKSEETNPNKSSFFIDEFWDYWPVDIDKKEDNQPFPIIQMARQAFPQSEKENPSAWETAIGLIDAIAEERSADRLKKIILNFETMCQFDLVFFPGNPQ